MTRSAGDGCRDFALATAQMAYVACVLKLKFHSSILIRTIAELCQHDILSVAAKYGINRWIILSFLSRNPCGRHLLQLLYSFFCVFLILSVYVSLLLFSLC